MDNSNKYRKYNNWDNEDQTDNNNKREIEYSDEDSDILEEQLGYSIKKDKNEKNNNYKKNNYNNDKYNHKMKIYNQFDNKSSNKIKDNKDNKDNYNNQFSKNKYKNKKKDNKIGTREIEFEVTELNKNLVYNINNQPKKNTDELNLNAKEYIPKKYQQPKI